jgi:hypothetical protein
VGGERRERSKNKQTYLLCFLKKEEEREREELAPPFARVFKTDPTPVIYQILEDSCSLRGNQYFIR